MLANGELLKETNRMSVKKKALDLLLCFKFSARDFELLSQRVSLFELVEDFKG